MRHTQQHPQLWDVEATKHTPEQMGLACFFANRSSLHTLPCAYLYDIGAGCSLSAAQAAAGPKHVQGLRERGVQADPAARGPTARRGSPHQMGAAGSQAQRPLSRRACVPLASSAAPRQRSPEEAAHSSLLTPRPEQGMESTLYFILYLLYFILYSREW